MKVSTLATVTALVGPAAIALVLLANKEEEPFAHDKYLKEILAEIDRGEWVDHVAEEDAMPSIEKVKEGAGEMILDSLLQEYGFRFKLVDLTVRHTYDDFYEGYLRTNHVSLHSSEYQFWFRSDGSFFFLESFTPMYTEDPEPKDIDEDFNFFEGLDGK
jgi:hypothetical protein